ncbi:MAG: type II toxin-antitoxin system VapC family toxin [Truepera sp.]|nr:type II toxin-antitoxin system VapC family toxin [Truepera sp.]
MLLWPKARLGEIGRGEAGTLAAAIAEMPLHRYDDEVLGAAAARLALDRPVYDCVYLALAYRIGGQVVTADARLANALAATEHGGSVGLLGGFVSE